MSSAVGRVGGVVKERRDVYYFGGVDRFWEVLPRVYNFQEI